MKFEDRYTVVFNPPVTGFTGEFVPWLYNTSEFMALKEGYKPVSCYLLDNKEKSILIVASFLCHDFIAISLPRAPFGGISYRHVSIRLLRYFVKNVIHYFVSRNFKKIVIKSPADVYNASQNAVITNCLIKAGFTVSNFDINHHLDVDHTPFSEKIHKMEIRKLRKSIAHRLDFEEVPLEAMSKVYNFIKVCRDEKKVPINITFNELCQAAKKFPQNYKFFTVVSNGSIVAATVAVLVSRHVLYNYLPASLKTHNKLSPMVFLLSELYKYCQSGKVKILDLGISTIDNKPQESLILFKERVGGKATLKLTFELNLV